MSGALTTIVIPTYNRLEHLRRSLASALAQSSNDVEVLVVDDGCSDGTHEFLVAHTDPRVRHVRHAVNRGRAAAWLTGIEHAAGDYLAFLSDDDLMLPSFVERRAARLDGDPNIAVVFSPYEIRSSDDRRLAVVGADPAGERMLSPIELLRAVLSRRWFLIASLYRRASLVPLPERLVHSGNALDLAINVELALRGAKGAFLAEPDVVYRDHPEQERHGPLWRTTFEQTENYLAAVLAEEAPRADVRRLLRRERSNWHVVWARRARDDGRGVTGRHLLHAIRVDVTNLWAWRQTAAVLAGHASSPQDEPETASTPAPR